MDSLLEELGKGQSQDHTAFAAAPPVTSLSSTACSPGHWLIQASTADAFPMAMGSIPEALRTLVLEAARVWKMEPGPILATLLHVLAGVIGTRHRLRRGHLGFSCPFNMVVCGETRSRQNWMEFLAEPWLGPIRTRLRMHQAFGAGHFVSELKNLEQTSSLAYSSIFDKDRLRMQARLNLAPCGMERSPIPEKLLNALKHSLFRTVVSLNGGIDPMAEIHARGRKTVTELCRILEMAWRDMDLPDKGPIPRRGVVHLLWRTEVSQARQVVLNTGSSWNALSPPVLFVKEGPPPTYLVPLSAEAYAGWAELSAKLATSLESSRQAGVWSLSPEADAIVARFHCDIMVATPELAPLNSHQFSWLHELVVRLGMLLAILENLNLTSPAEEFVISADQMEKACSLGRWLACEHVACLRLLRHSPAPADDPDEEFDDIDNIDMDRLKAAILDRLTTKGPLSRRDLSRSFHEMPARARDCALSSLKKGRLVVESGNGKLSVADSLCQSADNVSVSAPSDAPSEVV